MSWVSSLNSPPPDRLSSGDVHTAALRKIRSFVQRQGRITSAQQRALNESWKRFGVEANSRLLNPVQLFGRCAPLVLEIGFGDGESLVTMAAAHPELDYLGIEVHRPGIGHLLLRATAMQLSNLRILYADAVEILEQQVSDEGLDRIQIFFPDPWPKMRHRKRRLIQERLVTLLVKKLKPHGQLHIATDCEDYACSILALLNTTPGLTNTASDRGFAPRPAWRPLTKFEQRGQKLGHVIRDMLFTRGYLAEPGSFDHNTQTGVLCSERSSGIVSAGGSEQPDPNLLKMVTR